jgi:hypothetical protein
MPTFSSSSKVGFPGIAGQGATGPADRTATTVVPSGQVRELAPRPRTLQETGVGETLLADLLSKHLQEAGVLDLREVSERLALAGSIVEELLYFLRAEKRVEVRGRSGESPLLRFALTEQGREGALDALMRDGYVGPAPVPLAEYERVVAAQSIRHQIVTREAVHELFSDTVIRPDLLDQLGPAVHSGRALFIYGDPGTGKSFIARRVSRLLGGPVLIPRALLVADSVIQLFQPGLHWPVAERAAETGISLDQGHDPRYVLCERPVVTAGGELTLDRLDLQFDGVTRRYLAPLQLRANNGLLLIDDLGRQRLEPAELFNRWIVPLEEHRDYLTLKAGLHFAAPFDLVLVLSTNLNPLELADEAFLRRIGYKIRFETLEPPEYEAIWAQVCAEQGIESNPELVAFAVEELHGKAGTPLLPCHPRDLLGLARDYLRYMGQPALSREALAWAWNNYFIRLT